MHESGYCRMKLSPTGDVDRSAWLVGRRIYWLFVYGPPLDGSAQSLIGLNKMQTWPDARTVGVIGDTHGLIRESVIQALARVDLILHAGDVGRSEVLGQLRKLAPVVAIAGNIDSHIPSLPPTEIVSVRNRLIYLIHSLADLDLNPTVAGISMVVSGHSHKPSVHEKDGVLYVNPGSIGPRRFKLPISFALAEFHPTFIEVKLKELAE